MFDKIDITTKLEIFIWALANFIGDHQTNQKICPCDMGHKTI